MNALGNSIIRRTRVTFEIPAPANGQYQTPQVLDVGVRGQIMSISLREAPSGTIDELTLFVFDSTTEDGLSKPALEDVVTFATFTGIVASAEEGQQDLPDAAYYQVKRPDLLRIGLTINNTATADPATIILEIYALVQSVGVSG